MRNLRESDPLDYQFLLSKLEMTLLVKDKSINVDIESMNASYFIDYHDRRYYYYYLRTIESFRNYTRDDLEGIVEYYLDEEGIIFSANERKRSIYLQGDDISAEPGLLILN